MKVVLPTHELVILTKFHKDWPKSVKVIVIDQFCASSEFFASVSRTLPAHEVGPEVLDILFPV